MSGPANNSKIGKNERTIETQDGMVIDRNGRVIGNTSNMPLATLRNCTGQNQLKPLHQGNVRKRRTIVPMQNARGEIKTKKADFTVR